jgi:hypothetical protein
LLTSHFIRDVGDEAAAQKGTRGIAPICLFVNKRIRQPGVANAAEM